MEKYVLVLIKVYFKVDMHVDFVACNVRKQRNNEQMSKMRKIKPEGSN